MASPGCDTAGEGEEEEGDDGWRNSATESNRDDPYSPGIGKEAGQEGEVEMDVEADADEHETTQFTWVRVSTAPPLQHRRTLRSNHQLITPPCSSDCLHTADPLRVQMCAVCDKAGSDAQGAVSSKHRLSRQLPEL